ncbi:MAG: hypothetical protein FHOMOCKG_00036 [Methanophagales virus GBV302]|uniref:Uncharacterized protein n=1 Tax=Methanophagales virus GBV302 TaxID=2999281 RepID=A0A9E9A620_9CAUD|nr:MAG: hypothetical protein QIT37_gp036 [Methanophagales virus GBV302]WAE39564.1 MAG: hypothetical protein FHOMOCKG_00036 [Methanophagales virus GBV302]
MIEELSDLGLKLITRAIELEEKACNEEDAEDKLKYSYMSDGLMEGVRIVEKEIEKRKKELKKRKQLDKAVGRALGKYAITILTELRNEIEKEQKTKLRKRQEECCTMDDAAICSVQIAIVERIETMIMKRINEIKRRHGI